MTQDEAEALVGKTVELAWGERDGANALITEVDGDWLVSDEGLGFRIESMRLVGVLDS